MEQLLEMIQTNVHMAPWLIFGALCLAGLNIPVSEDAMLFISALLAVKNPEFLWPLFFAVYGGAYVSDLICYTLGLKLGPKLFKIKFFSSMVPQERLDKINSFYAKYGVVTLLLGRFIPFGVRNGLFLTAGLGKMNPIRFAISDLVACTISCSAFFSLYYTFGESVIEFVKKFNIVIFCIAILVVAATIVKKRKEQGNKNLKTG